ncbi:MAG: hypothetical protein O7H41_05000 [Planctomycetota bacterium]|nr:hypothetical protein [Planctomycetota bacterium]
MNTRLFLAGLVICMAGCAGPAHQFMVPDSMICTVKRFATQDQENQEVLYQFEAKFRQGETVLQAPRVVMHSGQWATITLTSVTTSLFDASSLTGEVEPDLDKVKALESGTYLAVRCTEGEGSAIKTHVRAYFVEESEIVWSMKFKTVFEDGENRTF